MPSKSSNNKGYSRLQSDIATIHLDTDYRAGLGKELEQHHYALCIYATWLARAVLRQAGIEANTSHSAEHSAQPALTFHPNNCTVGVPSSCKTGGSNK
ncbi:MAG: hypothetical protein P9X24_04675 [Candidatus Hatepunaea meridiana]|nr:hypothetical protein [Candidatus Hatepunaea meridiana]